MEAPRLDVLSVVVSLGLLCYFKYGHFLLENFVHLAALAGFKYTSTIEYRPARRHLVLHLRHHVLHPGHLPAPSDAGPQLPRLRPLVTFFPHLVAGPIVRPTELVPQFQVPHKATPHQLRFGWP